MKPLYFLFLASLCVLSACDRNADFAEGNSAFHGGAPMHSDPIAGTDGSSPEVSKSYSHSVKTKATEVADARGAVSPPTEEAVKEQAVAVDTRKIIKQGEVRFETDDLNAMRSRVNDVMLKHGGYISKENETKTQETLETNYVLRMPADKFDAVLNNISTGVDRFDTRRIDAQDVTEEYIDVEARINTKKALAERYAQLLAKATTVESILAIERQIGDLQGDIEAAEGRLRFLQSRVGHATLAVNVYQRIAAPIGFGSKFAASFVTGWHALLYVVIGLSSVWPFLLLIGGVMLVAFRMQKKRRFKPAEA